ncbi:hypothetical protein FB451DRAFT_1277381 [Mycena latifolia]|nr:hypothetical protein FB451DRAFT_1277381 [Mycena latifolia]
MQILEEKARSIKGIIDAMDDKESAVTSSDEPQLLTFVICTPDAGDQFPNDPIAIRLEDVHFLEEQVPEGGHTMSTHTSAKAVNWVERHYETDLLETIRTAGIGGPIATMLSPNTPALALFGSILDDHVLELAKALSNASAFVVMVRPAEHDPLPKFLAAQEIPVDIEMDTEKSSESSNDETDSEEDFREQSDGSDVGDSDSGDEYGVRGAFRPRGGALVADGNYNTGDPDYIVPAGIVRPEGAHRTRVKLHLQLHQNSEPYDVAIISKTAFKFQTEKSETSDMVAERITRAQILSCVDLKVEAQPVEVLTERSYSNLGFLVHRPDSIAGREYLPRGFDPPATTATRGTQKTTENMGELLVGVQSLKPAITAKLTHKRTIGQTVQLAENKPTPLCHVQERIGKEWDADGKSYSSYDVTWHPMADANGNPHPVDFRFGMGIEFGGKEERYITRLPTISHILRNQVILWVFDPQLKAKVRGLIVLTSTYIPDIKIAEPLDISEREVVDLALNSSVDPPILDNAPLPHDAANLVAIALVEQSADAGNSGIRNRVDKFISLLSGRKTKKPPLIDLPLYEYVSRGWDITNNQWRNTVWPRLDSGLGDADRSSSAAWNLTLPQGLPEDATDGGRAAVGNDPPAIEQLEQGLLMDPTAERPEEAPTLPVGVYPEMDVDPT